MSKARRRPDGPPNAERCQRGGARRQQHDQQKGALTAPELGDGALAEPMRFEKMPFVPLDTRLAQYVAVCSHAGPPDKIGSSYALRRTRSLIRCLCIHYALNARLVVTVIARNVSIALRHLGEKFRLQEEAQKLRGIYSDVLRSASCAGEFIALGQANTCFR